MKCPNCSAELKSNARFCPFCGTSIDSADNNTLSENVESDFVPTNPGYNADIFRDETVDHDNAAKYQGNRAQRRAGRHNQKPNNSKKPLIIAIIALVLVVAIALGVIFFVSRKTVSAKELNKAKENYLPPAQAVTIDTSLSDPSNDQIQFKYDDRARIISCTYSINKMTYDQSYTYDNAQRKINVETTFRAQPIFTKELDYDRVTKPDTFEDIDGYYIRLSKEDLADAGATEPPQETAAPEATEPPTDPPTEPPTEEPTDPPTEWKELYIDYLNTSDMEYISGRLIYLNDDDIPELFLEFIPVNTAHFEICWVNNNTVQHQQIGGGIPTYKERSGNYLSGIGTNEGDSMWLLNHFDGIEITRTRSGRCSPTSSKYELDNEEVSQEEYESVANEFKEWNRMYDADNMTKIDSLPDYIRNY